ncbi:MAG: tRNA preQ1(34) S-adenosylmethionine ribosyltransferase-isomerase QueA [Endomicrobium sp.]|jgi:S-adenosylmethionine:tRNA ribosyltransferase-isomerase|nr:tRNA preQ1(34) S-adenosylmethionine ribosyltransferase-isomerase QueA [Endomicrobium sp.]
MSDQDDVLSSYDYLVSEKLIAQKPAENRQDSRLFVIDRRANQFYHRKFPDIIEYFNAGDCLIINNTKVVPSRLFGRKDSGGIVELLFLNLCQNNKECKVLLKPSLSLGREIYFKGNYKCKVVSKSEFGETIVKFNKHGILDFLQEYGIMPLPHYINRKGFLAEELSAFDRERYQTVYAKNSGAIAAPTAGLHFTKDILKSLKIKGINIATLTLHVGWGTFKPIVTTELSKHGMIPEKFVLDKENADIINLAVKNNKKVIAVGTTSVRASEYIAEKVGIVNNDKTYLKECCGNTSIFIYPGYKFKIINTLITNFHLPKSTPLIMASAFSSREIILKAYKEAIKKKYRFFSYGDSMLIL